MSLNDVLKQNLFQNARKRKISVILNGYLEIVQDERPGGEEKVAQNATKLCIFVYIKKKPFVPPP